MKKIIIAVLIILAGAGAFLMLKKKPSEIPVQKKTRFLMDTYCTIQIPGGPEVLKNIDLALDKVEELDRKFSIFNKEGQLYKFNNQNIPITDKEIVDLVRVALDVSEKSGGAFDITITPLVKLWGFYGVLPEHPSIPKDADIKSSLGKIGYKYLKIEGSKVIKTRNDIELDLGGIAKGYAVGELNKFLRALGVKSAVIDLGSDIYVIGLLNNKPWRVGIKNPRGEKVLGVLEMTDLSVGTSGDYERFFEKDGVRYCHIIDPRTGYPARGVISVTIITPNATLGDALSKPVFILGPEKGLKFLANFKETEAVIVTDKGEVICSEGLKGMTQKIPSGGGNNEK